MPLLLLKIAALGVTKGAVSRWMRRARAGGGPDALHKRTVPGASCRLSAAQQARVVKWLQQGRRRTASVAICGPAGAPPRGSSASWASAIIPGTSAGFCKVGAGVRNCPSGALASATRTQSTGAARSAGRPSQNQALREGRTLLFIDESGFYLLPAVARTYAPIGRDAAAAPPAHSRPPLGHRRNRTHGAGLLPRLRLCDHSREVIRFLRHIQGKLLIVWDGAPIHRSRAVKQLLHEGAAARIHPERFPGHAPELDPEEGVWRHLKYVDLRNVCCADLADTRRELRAACQRLRQKPRVIEACVAHVGLV